MKGEKQKKYKIAMQHKLEIIISPTHYGLRFDLRVRSGGRGISASPKKGDKCQMWRGNFARWGDSPVPSYSMPDTKAADNQHPPYVL